MLEKMSQDLMRFSKDVANMAAEKKSGQSISKKSLTRMTILHKDKESAEGSSKDFEFIKDQINRIFK